MPRTRASKQKRLKETVPVVGAVGVSLTLAGGASAAGTVGLPADIPFRATAPGPTITLTEEEISDVSLATFYVFDREVPGRERRTTCPRWSAAAAEAAAAPEVAAAEAPEAAEAAAAEVAEVAAAEAAAAAASAAAAAAAAAVAAVSSGALAAICG